MSTVLSRLRGSEPGGRFLWRSALRAIQRNRPPGSLPGLDLKTVVNLLTLVTDEDEIVLTKDVRLIKSVGSRRGDDLNKAGIYTSVDLLYHFPRQYLDRTQLRQAGACQQGETATLRGRVVGVQEDRPRRGMTVTKMRINDGLGVFLGVWFNQPFIKKSIPVGSMIYVTGKVERGYGVVQVAVTDYEVDEGNDPLSAGRLTPVYPLTGKLNQRYLRNLINGVLEQTEQESKNKENHEHMGQCSPEFLPQQILEKHQLPSLPTAWRNIHFPDTMESAEKARERFIFEELFLYQLALAVSHRDLAKREKTHSFGSDGELIREFLHALPFRLTTDQERVWREITGDLQTAAPMYRLLHGEVGSGKTVIAAMALLKAVENGLQGVMMAPTEILAEQHFLSLKEAFSQLGVRIGLLTGSMSKKEKKAVYEQIAAGTLQVVMGTHAMIQEQVSYHRLGLVIIDEQHRFGVRQRAALQGKGLWPDTLVMTATPIPRTLALTVYGDLDLSMIRELPPGRRPVRTYAIPYRMLTRAYGFLHQQVKSGRQGYIVCPLVEDSEKITSQSVISLAEEVANKEFKDCRVGMLHGRLAAAEKERIMADFRQGAIDILVSTTVIEVGVDVANATVMIILDAERFGLAQLHQLRGRIGRGSEESHCVLVTEPKTPEGRTRIQAMTKTADGFELAEEDLRIRGPGEFTGVRQAGLPEFRIADLLRDWAIMQTTRAEAIKLIATDPNLEQPENSLLMERIRQRFSGMGYAGVG